MRESVRDGALYGAGRTYVRDGAYGTGHKGLTFR